MTGHYPRSTLGTTSVVDVDDIGVARIVHSLAQRVIGDGFAPSFVVAVLKGGASPAQLMLRELSSAGIHVVLAEVPSSRTGLDRLKPFKAAIAPLAPLWALNRLRRIEHRVQTTVISRITGARTQPPNAMIASVFADIASRAIATPASPILIVDDAVDSGMTVRRLIEAAQSKGLSRACIKIVALTATTAAAEAIVDYVHYRRVLCRFPWSVDSR